MLFRTRHDMAPRNIFTSQLCDLYSVNIYLYKVNNRNTNKICEICQTLTIKKHQNDVYDVVMIVNFEHISHLFLVSLLLTLSL